jgi:hypothetical protein
MKRRETTSSTILRSLQLFPTASAAGCDWPMLLYYGRWAYMRSERGVGGGFAVRRTQIFIDKIQVLTMKANATFAVIITIVILLIVMAVIVLYYYPTYDCTRLHSGNMTAIGECMAKLTAPR